MDEKLKVISPRLLAIASFREDLRSLLTLRSDRLKEISRIADSKAGFSYSGQIAQGTPELRAVERLTGVLRATAYLYDRVHDQGLSPKEAVAELKTLLSTLDIETSEDKEEALEDLLHLKPHYEKEGKAEERSVSVVPHYSDAEGVCDIRVIFDRDAEHVLKRIPVVLFTIHWHDDSGNSSQATVQFLREDWTRFQKKIERLARELNSVSKEVDLSAADRV